MLISARHYVTGEPLTAVIEGGLVRSLEKQSTASPDLQAGWMAPALFDLQINGCVGHSFNSEKITRSAICRIVAVCLQHGIAAFCPTLITNAAQPLLHALTLLKELCESSDELAAAMPVFHLEGPYISLEDGPRGAHPRTHVRPPDWDEFRRFQEAAGGRIRLVTLAPELPGALRFIERLAEKDVRVAIGHTAASGACIRAAILAGARLSTHLGNGSHALLPRHDNYVWEQLAADELWASIICDGPHLPPALVRCLLRVKTPARTILTCDASSLAGLPPGRYKEWGQDLEVLPEGKIVVSDSGFLAGSGAFTDVCIGNAIRYAGVSLQDAVDMASARPRELLGLPPRKLQAGEVADLVLFDWEPAGDFRVEATIVGGVAKYVTSQCKND